MNLLTKVSVYIIAVQCCEIVCLPRYHFEKRFHFEIVPLPLEHFAFVLEKITPFGKYELKHHIHKRQTIQSEISPVSNEIPVTNAVVEDIPKVPEVEILDKKEKDLAPEVIITSIIKPVEHGKSFSFVLPVESEVLITPAEKEGDIIKQPVEVLLKPELIPKPEEVVPPPGPIIEIIPKPVEIPPPPPPPPAPKPVVENVVISTPIESTVPPVPPLIPVPVPQNPNGPIITSVVDNVPKTPLLFTDITQIPLSGIPYPAPVPVPAPEVIVPPPPPPPPPVKEPPVIKEETPNFLVKGSRFVLYFGSMMLQMLSQLVNGRINLNQPLPFPAVLPEIQ